MIRLCREKEWANTPLGPAEDWAQSLRTAVSMVLGSAFPSIVLWGAELVQIYNDGYIPFLGAKHPWGLGRPTRECWPEAWEFNEPIYDRVRAGETVALTDQLYRLRRGGSAAGLDDVYITISYSPVLDESGAVGGVLITLLDTTAQVQNRQLQDERERLLRHLQLERARLGTVFQEAPAFIATTRGADHVVEMANPPYFQLVGHREIVGKPAREAIPEAESQGFIALLDEVYRTAKPFVGNEMRILLQREPGGAPEERFVNFVYQPLAEPDGGVGGILAHGVDVTELVHTRHRVEEQAAELEATTEELRMQATQLEEVQVELEVSNEELRQANVILEEQIQEAQAARRTAEEARRAGAEQAQVIDTLQRVGHTVAAELDTQRIVQEVTDAATQLTGAQFGAFFYNVLNEKGESFTLYTISGVPREMFSKFPMPRATQVFSPTFHGEGVVRVDDIRRDPRYGKNAPYNGMPKGHLPVVSYLAVPVISRSGEVQGGLFFGHENPGVFREHHEQLAVGIAAWAAVALDNARLYEGEHRARAEAERANRVKSEFLATMSHELRTPLNATIGYAELMLAGIPEAIPEASQEQTRRIALSARHLLGLIEEILTFSRLEAGEEQLDVERVDLGTMVREACVLTEPLALQKGLHFECRAPDEPGTVETDSRKLLQILLNLLGNAVKFTEAGRVVLSLELVGDEVIFRVEDTGHGISEGDLARVFDPFWQAEFGPTRKAGGTGLGLSVTRRLARLMGGDVEVESTVDQGSTFTIRLPRHVPAAEELR